MNLIAAVDQNWAIGYKGQLLVRIPADHRMFRQETLDKVVVYGRKRRWKHFLWRSLWTDASISSSLRILTIK